MNPLPALPSKRLIVFAGVSSHQVRAHALASRKVEAVMASFELVKKGKWWERTREILDTWPQYRYLDSGVFTLIRQAGMERVSGGYRDRELKVQPVDERIRALKEHMEDYATFLRAHKDEWDFIIEMDVDTLDYGSVTGVEVARTCRRLLHRIVGDKLMPVWHPIAGHSAWREMVSTFPFVALGSGNDPRERTTRYLVDEAHRAGAKVHGLGMSRADILSVLPVDTVDSVTWLSSVRFGQFGGHRFTHRSDTNNMYIGRNGTMNRKGVTARETARGLRIIELVREMGYDPDELTKHGSSQQTKYEVAVALLQIRQDEANKSTRSLAFTPILEGT